MSQKKEAMMDNYLRSLSYEDVTQLLWGLKARGRRSVWDWVICAIETELVRRAEGPQVSNKMLPPSGSSC